MELSPELEGIVQGIKDLTHDAACEAILAQNYDLAHGLIEVLSILDLYVS